MFIETPRGRWQVHPPVRQKPALCHLKNHFCLVVFCVKPSAYTEGGTEEEVSDECCLHVWHCGPRRKPTYWNEQTGAHASARTVYAMHIPETHFGRTQSKIWAWAPGILTLNRLFKVWKSLSYITLFHKSPWEKSLSTNNFFLSNWSVFIPECGRMSHWHIFLLHEGCWEA